MSKCFFEKRIVKKPQKKYSVPEGELNGVSYLIFPAFAKALFAAAKTSVLFV